MALLPQQNPKIGMRIREIRFYRYRLAKALFRLFVAAEMRQGRSEIVERLGMRGVKLDRFLIEGGCLGVRALLEGFIAADKEMLRLGLVGAIGRGGRRVLLYRGCLML